MMKARAVLLAKKRFPTFKRALSLENIFEIVRSKMWQNTLLQAKMALLSSSSLALRRRNWLYQILKIWNKNGKCYIEFSFLLSHVRTPTEEVKPSQARMTKVRQSTPD